MRVLFFISTYLRKLLRWWKEEVLSLGFYYRYADFIDGMRRMNAEGEMIEPNRNEVYKSIYGDGEQNSTR